MTIACAVHSPNSELIAFGELSGKIKIVDAQNGNVVRCFNHGSAVVCLSYSFSGELLVSAGDENDLKLWNTESVELVAESDPKFIRGVNMNQYSICTMAMSCNGESPSLLTCMRDRCHNHDSTLSSSLHRQDPIHFWDLLSLRPISRFDTCAVCSANFNPVDPTALALGCFDGCIKMWNCSMKTSSWECGEHTAAVHAVCFTPPGEILISCAADSTIRTWCACSGQLFCSLLGHHDVVHCIAISPDGKKLLSSASDMSLRLWNIYDGRELANIPTEKQFSTVAINQDDLIVASCLDGELFLLDIFEEHGDSDIQDLKEHIVPQTRAKTLDEAKVERHEMKAKRRPLDKGVQVDTAELEESLPLEHSMHRIPKTFHERDIQTESLPTSLLNSSTQVEIAYIENDSQTLPEEIDETVIPTEYNEIIHLENNSQALCSERDENDTATRISEVIELSVVQSKATPDKEMILSMEGKASVIPRLVARKIVELIQEYDLMMSDSDAGQMSFSDSRHSVTTKLVLSDGVQSNLENDSQTTKTGCNDVHNALDEAGERKDILHPTIQVHSQEKEVQTIDNSDDFSSDSESARLIQRLETCIQKLSSLLVEKDRQSRLEAHDDHIHQHLKIENVPGEEFPTSVLDGYASKKTESRVIESLGNHINGMRRLQEAGPIANEQSPSTTFCRRCMGRHAPNVCSISEDLVSYEKLLDANFRATKDALRYEYDSLIVSEILKANKEMQDVLRVMNSEREKWILELPRDRISSFISSEVPNQSNEKHFEHNIILSRLTQECKSPKKESLSRLNESFVPAEANGIQICKHDHHSIACSDIINPISYLQHCELESSLTAKTKQLGLDDACEREACSETVKSGEFQFRETAVGPKFQGHKPIFETTVDSKFQRACFPRVGLHLNDFQLDDDNTISRSQTCGSMVSAILASESAAHSSCEYDMEESANNLSEKFYPLESPQSFCSTHSAVSDVPFQFARLDTKEYRKPRETIEKFESLKTSHSKRICQKPSNLKNSKMSSPSSRETTHNGVADHRQQGCLSRPRLKVLFWMRHHAKYKASNAQERKSSVKVPTELVEKITSKNRKMGKKSANHVDCRPGCAHPCEVGREYCGSTLSRSSTLERSASPDSDGSDVEHLKILQRLSRSCNDWQCPHDFISVNDLS